MNANANTNKSRTMIKSTVWPTIKHFLQLSAIQILVNQIMYAAFIPIVYCDISVSTAIRNNQLINQYFADNGPKNVTAIVGQSVMLKCTVKSSSDRTISWMRKRDLHILTAGIQTYTGDGRFTVHHPESSNDWDLRIDYVQKRDSGVYECQINTQPKLKLAILLLVEDARANIWGSSEIFVKKWSTIALTCSVNVHSLPPSSIVWYQGDEIVDFDQFRSGISLETEKSDSGTTSKLLVTKATVFDSGNYTCMPSNAYPASVLVHVLNGEHPAAMQTSCAKKSQYFTLLATGMFFMWDAFR